MQSAKQAAQQIIEHLPDQASWDEIIYQLYVKQKIEMGPADVRADRTVSHEEVKADREPPRQGKQCISNAEKCR